MRALLLLFCLSLFAEDKISNHLILLDSGPLSYTATVGTIPAKDAEGKVKGEIGYIAYVKEGSLGGRPVTFVFNGGPGCSSVWLHMGAFGPKRIVSPEEGAAIVPPYPLVDNQETILDLTDLVFIDPMGSGKSHAESKEDEKTHYGVKEDIRAVGEFIYSYVNANNRWNSPKYIAGESYGTPRACGLAEYLQGEHGMYLNGLILVSCALDFQTFFFDQDNQLPYFLFFPTYATTAWYHQRYRPEASLEEVAEEARQFAYEVLAPAYLRRSSLSRSEKEDLYQQIAKMTGLPDSVVKRHQGRIHEEVFFLEFFGDEQKAVGRFDTRIKGDYTNPALVGFSQDPSITTTDGIYSGAFRYYLQNHLQTSPEYRLFSEEANRQWNFLSLSPWGYPNLLKSLRSALVVNPKLKLYLGCGYFDAATPFAGTEYYRDHLDLPDSYDSNIQMEYYEGGHMYYLNPSARVKFKKDLIRFYR